MSRNACEDRSALLRSFDGVRRGLDDAHGSLAAVDAFHAQALDMIVSGKVGNALDVGKGRTPCP